MSDKLWAPNFMEAVRRVRSWLWRFENNHTFAPGAMDSDPILGEDIRGALFWDQGGTGENDALMVARKNSSDAMEYAETVMAVGGVVTVDAVTISNANGAPLTLTDSNAASNAKTIQVVAEGGLFYIRLLNDDGTVKHIPLLFDANANVYLNYSGGAAHFTEAANFGKEISLVDGIAAPSTVSGKAFIYVDSGSGDLCVKFGDGVTKVIAADT